MAKAVLIADDNAFIRQTLCELFKRETDFEVCGEAENGQEAIEKAQQLHPELTGMEPLNASAFEGTTSLQLRVLCLGFLQDGDVGVGVLPESEKVFVGSERADAGGIGFRALRGSRLQSVGTRFAQICQRSCPAVPDYTAVIENLLKLDTGRTALSGCQVCFAPDVRRVQTGTAEVGRKGDYSKLDRWESNL